MADVLLSGTVDGAGALSGAVASIFSFGDALVGTGDILGSPVGVLAFSGVLAGVDGLAGPLYRTILVGGQVHGIGALTDDFDESIGGTVAGTGTLSGTLYRILDAHPLPLQGFGTLGDHFPLPLVGYGLLSGYLEVTRLTCPRLTTLAPKTFRWNQDFGSGGLVLKTCEVTGVPFDPIVVVYSLYQVLACGTKVIVGPPNRRPVHQGVGVYYATGTAGECGQPGCWIIQWRWQRFWYEQPQVCEQPFRVLDAVLTEQVTGIHDGIPRVCKKGWL